MCLLSTPRSLKFCAFLCVLELFLSLNERDKLQYGGFDCSMSTKAEKGFFVLVDTNSTISGLAFKAFLIASEPG